jgi:hypothetical protein
LMETHSTEARSTKKGVSGGEEKLGLQEMKKRCWLMEGAVPYCGKL